MKNSKKIFETYYNSKKNSLYYNQIKELSNLSDSSLSRILKYLVEIKVLSVEKTKSNTYYNINDKKEFILEYCKIAYDKFKNLNRNVKIPLKNFINNLNYNIYTVILFGSASRNEELEGSDLDILIVTDIKNNNIKRLKNKINLTSVYPISIFECNIEEFENSNDHVVTQAKKTGFSIYKEQNFYETILNEYK